MSDITAFLGVIGSGKDFCADSLVRQGHTRIAFKDGLLNLASDIVGYRVDADYDWFKEHVVGMRRPTNPLLECLAHADAQALQRKNPEIMTGRRLLTRLGTEGMRSRDPDYWAKQFVSAARAELACGKSVVNSDCRFLNEVAAIRRLSSSSRFFFCNFKSPRYTATFDHESERLAQTLLRLGLRDGQEILDEDFARAEKELAVLRACA